MPTYPVINKETNKKTLTSSYDNQKIRRMEEENPDWDKDWSQGCAGQSTEFRWTGEARSSGWNEVLDRASKQPVALSANAPSDYSLYLTYAQKKKERPTYWRGTDKRANEKKRRKPNSDLMRDIDPLTENQKKLLMHMT